MLEPRADLGRPIRVVVFCGGPALDRAVVRLVTRLASHPEVEFVGGLCETEGRGPTAMVRDRVRRRGLLALPLLLGEALGATRKWLADPGGELALRRDRARVARLMDFVPDMHAAAALQRIRSMAPDLGLIYGGPILRPSLFQIPRLGTLGIHHGTMPQYRGKKTTFWAMYHGEEAAGVTIQRVDAGIDTGMIVRRGEVPTGSKSLARVTRELNRLGLDLYLQAVLDFKRGTASLVPPNGPKGRLCRDPGPGDFLRFYWRRLRRRWHVSS